MSRRAIIGNEADLTRHLPTDPNDPDTLVTGNSETYDVSRFQMQTAAVHFGFDAGSSGDYTLQGAVGSSSPWVDIQSNITSDTLINFSEPPNNHYWARLRVVVNTVGAEDDTITLGAHEYVW